MNCLLIRPRWMWEERDVIGNIPLNNLMIPGTHNSGSYIPKGSNVSFLTTKIDVDYEITLPPTNILHFYLIFN